MIKIGIDLSGGDYAPSRIIQGVHLARQTYPHIDIVGFICTEDRQKLTRSEQAVIESIEIVETEEKIAMEDKSTVAVRNKKESTITVGVKHLKEGKIDGFVSCGNTGAVVCAATLGLGLIENVERPGIGLFFPTRKGFSFLIDAGANIDPKPEHLLQYALMSQVYLQKVTNTKEVTVGLLNIGEEAGKGTDFVKQTHKLFSSSPINFVGNVEPKDMFYGKCDCVICDGFVGNITLKSMEGCAEVLGKLLFDALTKTLWRKIGLLFLRNAFREYKRKLDYTEYGGAPLLGVKGVVIIAHGRSNKTAVKNAIRVGYEEVERNVIQAIKDRMNGFSKNNRIG